MLLSVLLGSGSMGAYLVMWDCPVIHNTRHGKSQKPQDKVEC